MLYLRKNPYYCATGQNISPQTKYFHACCFVYSPLLVTINKDTSSLSTKKLKKIKFIVIKGMGNLLIAFVGRLLQNGTVWGTY